MRAREACRGGPQAILGLHPAGNMLPVASLLTISPPQSSLRNYTMPRATFPVSVSPPESRYKLMMMALLIAVFAADPQRPIHLKRVDLRRKIL